MRFTGDADAASVRLPDRTDEGSTTMTDTQGNIDEATKAAREAAGKVRDAAADGAESFGATAEEISDDLSANASTAGSNVSATVSDLADTVTDKVGDVLGGAKSAASDAAASVGKAADAAADAAKAAGAKIKGVADDVDFDGIVAQTRTVAGEWTEKIKQAYRERPGVVIAAAAGAVVLTAAILRNLGRR
jgi:gas vesicle protein